MRKTTAALGFTPIMVACTHDDVLGKLEFPRSMDIAAINSPKQMVLSGSQEAFSLLRSLPNPGVIQNVLKVAVPAHSRYLSGMVEEFRKYLEGVDFRAPTCGVVSNVTAESVSESHSVLGTNRGIRPRCEQLTNMCPHHS